MTTRPAPINEHHQAPTHRYHLFTLSTFTPHPLAKSPTLDFPPFASTISQTRQLLQIMGDTLVILVSRYAPNWLLAGWGVPIHGFGGPTNDEELVAWNWQTGQVLAVSARLASSCPSPKMLVTDEKRISLPENGWFSSIALLTPTTFMVTTTANVSPILPDEPRHIASAFPPVIQIYSFAPDPNHNIVPVQPLSADPFDDTTFRPVLVAQLHLPVFVPGCSISAFDIRPDPAFPPLPKGTPTLGERKPFTQDPGKGVLVLDIMVDPPSPLGDGVMRDTHNAHNYELFILRETLVEMAIQGEERIRRSRLPKDDEQRLEVWDVALTLRWEDWGEQHARLSEMKMLARQWVSAVLYIPAGHLE